jgi:hypothetical protein
MGKKDQLISELTPLLNDVNQLEKYLINNCNLPGPRANLELMFALSEIFADRQVLEKWLSISEEMAGANDPSAFLPMCALVCLGKYYIKNRSDEVIKILKKFSNDSRWRIRESVAFAFQFIGENDFKELEKIFVEWYPESNNLEKRTILVSLAHPNFLDKYSASFAIDITDKIFHEYNTGYGSDVLKKALEFAISVYTVYNPEKGFELMEKWTGVNKTFNTIIKSNLKKNRLIKAFP